MNKLLTVLTLVATASLSTHLLNADMGEMGGAHASFRGTITAVESDRDSFTVEDSDNQVKMFQVSPSRKDSLRTGQTVTVGYVDSYEWPLKTTSISTGEIMK